MIKKILIALLAIFSTYSIALANGDVFELEVTIKDHKFHPDIIEAPANTKIILFVHNEDDSIEEFESFDLKREKVIRAGEKIKVILAPLKAGEYKFFGEFHQETAQGKLIVK